MTVDAHQRVSRVQIEEALARFPRVTLTDLPTPLHECKRLSEALGGPRIFIKRDDLTGLALGGNKSRKLEYVFGDALAQGADTVIAYASAQSNLCRQVAAAGARIGIEVHLLLQAAFHNEVQGNLLLDHLLGANVQLVDDGARHGVFDMTNVRDVVAERAAELRAQGRTVYVINMHGPMQPLATVAYVNAALELQDQFAQAGIQPTHLITTSGSGGTHAGLGFTAAALGLPHEVVGISIRKSRAEVLEGVSSLMNKVGELLELPTRLQDSDVNIYDEYYGEGYAVPTQAGLDAIRLLASTEGILLDPVYTGKTMSGLIDLTRRGILGPDHTVVMIHTGGIPALFAYTDELMAGKSLNVRTLDPAVAR